MEKNTALSGGISNVVGERGLEPPRIATLDPKS
jgi:hypothetical protein